jgi:drug/metabolite transporter (DMT)-like permease
MLWMLGAVLCFLSMAIAGRELSAELNVYQILFLRGGVSLLVMLAILPRIGIAKLRTQRPFAHLARNLIHLGGQWGWFTGVAAIPLAEVFALEFTTPVWTALLAAVFLGERPNRYRLAAIALGLLGVLIILRPGHAIIDAASLAVLFAAVCYAAVYVLTRHLTTTEASITVVFYMTVMQLPVTLVPALPGWVWPSPALWPWVAVVGVSSMTAHYCMTQAFRHAEATVLIPLDFIRLPAAMAIGYLAYGEPLEVIVAMGAAIILAGNVVNVWGERKH